MFLRQRESNVSFTKPSLDAAAQAAGRNEQKNRDQHTIIWQADGNRENKHEKDDVGELTNEKKPELALRRHGPNENSTQNLGLSREIPIFWV